MTEQINIDNLDLTKYLNKDMEKLKVSDNGKEVNEWKDAGTKVGLWIWRIENFKVIPWPKDQYGKFYSGDSYIVLNSYNKGGNTLFHDIHFWLGETTTQDEAGTAAYKTVELDEHLGGGPVQHREIQGCESMLFLSYFKQVIIMEGGIDSGFNIVKPIEYKPQLFHIKSIGKTLTCTSVPLTTDSLNSGDVFVLDEGLTIYQWNGCKASGIEKHKAMELTSSLKSERRGKPRVTVFNQDDSDATPFWKALGGKAAIKDEPSVERLNVENPVIEKVLFRLSNATGDIVFKEEARDKISLSMLDTDDVFIIDVSYEIYIWVGNNSTVVEKTNAFQYAM
ncbi:actin depolymerizing protein, partial [Anaeromyces robustus]